MEDLNKKFPNSTEAYPDVWQYMGNCFDYTLVKKIIDKHDSKNPTFVSNKALSNALFDRKIDYFHGTKSDGDIIPVVPGMGMVMA